MKKRSLLVVLLLIACVMLIKILSGSSKITAFPAAEEIRIDEKNPSIASLGFHGRLDGMKKLEIDLPSYLRRRPLEVLLLDPEGEKAATLVLDPETARRSHRSYRLDRPIESSRGRLFVLHLILMDGPFLEDPSEKEEVFSRLALTTCYELNLPQAWKNYGLFKPVPFPLIFIAILFLLYAWICAALTGSLSKIKGLP